MSINNTPESRAFLAALVEEDEEASMAEIRNRTSLNEDKRQYQFRKLEKAGVIDVEYSEWGSPSNAPIKVATLTETGRELIDDGFLEDESSEVERASVDVIELAERLDALEARVAELSGEDTVEEVESEPASEPGPTPTPEDDEGEVFARQMGLLQADGNQE